MRKVRPGMRVRLKHETDPRWRGTVSRIAIEDEADHTDSVLEVVRDGYPLDGSIGGTWGACRYEVVIMKDQSPHVGSKLELVMNAWPDLTYTGFFVPGYREPLAEQAERKARDRAEMLEDHARKQFSRCHDFLSWNEIGSTPLGGKRLSSYYLKHRVEDWGWAQGDPLYVSNGMFIAAAISDGFKPRDIAGPNCNFLIGRESWPTVGLDGFGRPRLIAL